MGRADERESRAELTTSRVLWRAVGTALRAGAVVAASWQTDLKAIRPVELGVVHMHTLQLCVRSIRDLFVDVGATKRPKLVAGALGLRQPMSGAAPRSSRWSPAGLSASSTDSWNLWVHMKL